jgi:hypothetical protein
MAQRCRLLWHSLSIVAGVATVSVVISVLGDLAFNSGRAGVPAMLRKRPHAQLQAADSEKFLLRKSPAGRVVGERTMVLPQKESKVVILPPL